MTTDRTTNPRPDAPRNAPSRARLPSGISTLALLTLLALLVVTPLFGRDRAARAIPYSELVTLLQQGRIERVVIGRTEITAELHRDAASAERVRAERLPGLDAAKLVDLRKRACAMRATWRRPRGGPHS
jgi:hypothetical protein